MATREVGIKELKAHASEIVRQVSEHRARYVVSKRGKPVAVIVPVGNAEVTRGPAGETCEVPRPLTAEEADQARAAWDEFFRLGKLVDASWKSEKTSTEIISEMRR